MPVLTAHLTNLDVVRRYAGHDDGFVELRRLSDAVRRPVTLDDEILAQVDPDDDRMVLLPIQQVVDDARQALQRRRRLVSYSKTPHDVGL